MNTQEQEFNDRCWALIGKLGRGPEWEIFDNATQNTWQYRIGQRKSYGLVVVQCKNKAYPPEMWCENHKITPHEAACILKDWLEERLAEIGKLPERIDICDTGEQDPAFKWRPKPCSRKQWLTRLTEAETELVEAAEKCW